MLSLLLKAKLNTLRLESFFCISTKFLKISGFGSKEYILDFLKNCDKQTFEELRKKTIELRQTSEIKPLKIKCIHCQHEYEQPFTLNTSDFFG